MEAALLADLAEDDRRRILAAGRRRTFARNEVVFHEGDLGDAFHLLRHGHVAIRTTNRLGDVATLTIHGPGAGFGELALLADDARRSATAVALDEVETLSLHKDVFEQLRREHPGVERLLVLALAARVRDLSVQLGDAHFAPAELRVLRRLVALCATYGGADVAGSVSVPVSQETLASLAGTTRPTVNRVLRDAERKGLLALSRGCVVVADVERLRARSRA